MDTPTKMFCSWCGDLWRIGPEGQVLHYSGHFDRSKFFGAQCPDCRYDEMRAKQEAATTSHKDVNSN